MSENMVPAATVVLVLERQVAKLRSERDTLKRRVGELEVMLGAWQDVFGTTQLSHAKAKMDAQSAMLDRMAGCYRELLSTDYLGDGHCGEPECDLCTAKQKMDGLLADYEAFRAGTVKEDLTVEIDDRDATIADLKERNDDLLALLAGYTGQVVDQSTLIHQLGQALESAYDSLAYEYGGSINDDEMKIITTYREWKEKQTPQIPPV